MHHEVCGLRAGRTGWVAERRREAHRRIADDGPDKQLGGVGRLGAVALAAAAAPIAFVHALAAGRWRLALAIWLVGSVPIALAAARTLGATLSDDD